MTISAFPDMAGVILKYGLTSTFRDGFIPLIRNFKAVRLAGEEVKAAGTALDMVLDSRAMAFADVTDDFGRHSSFERGLASVSTRFGMVSLMAPWTAAMKQFSGLVVMTNILRSSERLAKGFPSPIEVRRLASASIDVVLAHRITAQFEKYGQKQGGVLLARAGDWDDAIAREAFRAAVVREVDRIIVTPGQDKPLWMSTELGKTIGQFKSFSVSSSQRIMLAGLQQRDAATLNGIMVSLGLGAFSYWAKERFADRELSDEPAQWVIEAIDKSGLTGWLMEVNAISEKVSRGTVGLSAITGKQISRYASRNATASLLGPSLGTVQDMINVAGSVATGSATKRDLHTARTLLPAQNLFYLRRLFDRVEAATGDSLALPER
ncbi:hypothetical protein [Pseudorhizobium endolithicum]|nr:hypothetical protein [Pseudorhizobium endolithicum]